MASTTTLRHRARAVQAEQLRLVITRLARTPSMELSMGCIGVEPSYVRKQAPVVGYGRCPLRGRMLRSEQHLLTAEPATWFAEKQ